MVLDSEFESMFDLLDPTRRGYLTTQEVQKFYQSLFYKPVHNLLAESVVQTHGGGKNKSQCTKKCFEDVLMKLEEFRALEESTYWDFIALDQDGTRVVSIKNCLFLARSVKADQFSMELWNEWINSRNQPSEPVSWCEFQQYIYFVPAELKPQTTDEENAYNQEMNKLTSEETAKLDQKYNDFKEILEDDESYMAKLQLDQEDYHNNVMYESQRLMNRWNVGGIEAVIYDDGSELQEREIVSEEKNSLTIPELLSGLATKYDILREKVIMQMANAHAVSENLGREPTNEELNNFFQEIQKMEKQLRKNKSWNEFHTIPGANSQHSFTALGVMGETADAYHTKWAKAENRYKTLRADGRSTEEINKIYEQENLEQMKGSSTSGDILIHLGKRQEEEKEYLLQSLRKVPSSSIQQERIAIYASLHRQCLRAEEYGMFYHAATSACLAERNQLPDFERYNPDRPRQEQISSARLKQGEEEKIGQKIPGPTKPSASHSKNLGTVDSWLEITRLLAQKHSAERKMMIHFLLSEKLHSSLEELKKENEKELATRRRTLSKQQDISKELAGQDKSQSRYKHLEMLSSAAALYCENLVRQHKNLEREMKKISMVVLGRLQVLQDVECQNVLTKMKSMGTEDLYHLRKEVYRSARDESFENISSLLLGVVEISPEEKELVGIIMAKYNNLRTKLFEEFVKKQNVTDGMEHIKMLDKLRAGEEKNRSAGNHAKLARLCKETFKMNYQLQEIMGPELSRFKPEAEYYLEEIRESSRKRKLINESPAPNNQDPASPHGNVISELHLRYEDEVETILENLRNCGMEEKSFLIAAESAWQQWEMLRFNLDDKFAHAALGMGLCERVKAGEGKVKLRQDNMRYVSLAQERLQISPSLNTKSLNAIASKTTPSQSSLRRVLLCHAKEWRQLYDLFTDESAEELREAAGTMSEEERSKRMAEINAKRLQFNMKSNDWEDDQIALLEEAAAIKYVTRMQNLKGLSGDGKEDEIVITNTDILVSIMADLQEEHDVDGFRWFKKALEDPESAGQIKDLVVAESKMCTNIFNVLCKYEGQTDDDAILQALEDKYDSLRDKLLAEALMKQLGEKAWKEMSERERQERLLKLKLEERRLRREGNYDELAKLLGDAFANDERLRAALGLSKEEYERRLKERLANRRRGLDGIEEEEEDLGSGDLLSDLASRYEDEKNALLLMLRGQGDRYLSEQDRQRELARLRRELRKSEREERYGAAALVLGLAERDANMNKRLESDRKRQEELAKQRLAALKAKGKKGKFFPMPTISEEDEKIIRSGTKLELMDAALSKTELLHEAERAWFVHLLTSQSELKPDQTGINENDPVKLARHLARLQISDKLHSINSKIPGNQVNIKESRMSLIEASFFRQALLAHQELQKSDSELEKDLLDVKALALLQEVQDSRSKLLAEQMVDMNDDDLIKIQEKMLKWMKEGISENIPAALFAGSDEERMMEEALEGKFDAILAALVEKSLKDKKGEKKWNSMSKSDREQLIADTLEKVKKLLAEGKTEEAAALLGDVDPDLLLSLFGMKSDEEEKERMERERLERRKQRIADGMSEEEADRLMQEEAGRDEELLKKRRRNILDSLKFDLDAEKAALFRQRAEGDEKLDEERRRQLELARLRLQERMMQRENDLGALAHVLALSKLQADQLEAEKQRQLELARKRIEAYKNGRGRKEDEIVALKFPDSDDIATLIDIVVREMESKHAQERNVLLQLLTVDAALKSPARVKTSNLEEGGMKGRKSELRELRRQWRNSDPQDLKEKAAEQMEILTEAAAINLELVQKDNEINSEEEAQAEILAQLQNHQMKEASLLINDLPGKNPATLRTIAQVQWRARADRWLDNVAESSLQKSGGTETSSEEDEVLRALESKYDSVKDKLIAEALMRQMGEKEWEQLGERERQRRIMELKLKERRLREEGKLDEAAELISSLIKSDEDLARLLGEVKLSQEEELKKRLEMRKKLREERIAAGLAVDDETLDAELAKQEEEEKRQKRRNILALLEHNLDEEKEAILANLRRQDEHMGMERKRQLELARLRREHRQIEREDRFNAAALVFSQAKKNEEILMASLETNRERQLALAKERLASRKAMRDEREAARKLFDVEEVAKKIKILEEDSKDQSGSAPERLLLELDHKQANEREMLLLFLCSTEMDSDMRMEVSSMTIDQIKAEQGRISSLRREWREKRFMDLLHSEEDEDEEKKTSKRESLAQSIVEQNKNFKRYMILELEAFRRSQSENQDFAFAKSELSVKWLAEVQGAQSSAVEAVNILIADKSDEVLDMITYSQKKARLEAWNDNNSKVVMDLLPPGQMIQPIERSSSSMSMRSDERAFEDAEKKLTSLDDELDQQKDELEKKKLRGEEIDFDSAMAKLEQQHNAKKQALAAELQRQREKIKQRRDEKMHQREEMEYEAHAAAAMVFLAERRLHEREEHDAQEKSRQRNLMQERLEARKKKRKELEEAAMKKEEDEVDAPTSLAQLPLIPPMKREPTMIKAFSEEEKADALKKLQEMSELNKKKIHDEQKRQREKVEQKLRRKKHSTMDEASRLIQTFKREQTIVLEKKELELVRQKTMLQERIERVRTEKTKTFREKGTKKVRDFENLVNPEESKGMTEDERMKIAAENLQKKFVADFASEEPRGGTEEGASSSVEPKDDEKIIDENTNEGSLDPTASPASRRTTEKDRAMILKHRMSMRKQKKKQEIEEMEKSQQDENKMENPEEETV